MGLQRGWFAKRFSANFAAKRTLPVVLPHVADHGGLVAKLLMAYGAVERLFAGMLSKMVGQVYSRFEGLVARGAGKVPDVLVVGTHVRCEPAWLAECLVAVFAPNLPANAVGPEVVA